MLTTSAASRSSSTVDNLWQVIGGSLSNWMKALYRFIFFKPLVPIEVIICKVHLVPLHHHPGIGFTDPPGTDNPQSLAEETFPEK